MNQPIAEAVTATSVPATQRVDHEVVGKSWFRSEIGSAENAASSVRMAG